MELGDRSLNKCPTREEEAVATAKENPLGTAAEVGPRSNKVTAATLGATASSLFWATAAMTFAKSWDPARLATITTLSTAFVSALAGYFAQESQEYVNWNQRWQLKKRDRISARGEAQQAQERAEKAEKELRTAQVQAQLQAETCSATLKDRASAEEAQRYLLARVQRLEEAVSKLGPPMTPLKLSGPAAASAGPGEVSGGAVGPAAGSGGGRSAAR
jgi:hypothetical protein